MKMYSVGGYIVITFFLLSFLPVPKKLSKAEEIKLGQLFFFDKRLSINKTKSCSSCHDPQFAFTDGYRTPTGVFGDVVPHNTPTLINIAGNSIFNWANPNITNLQQQSSIPLFGTHPIEMGMDSNDTKALDYVLADEQYSSILKKNSINSLHWYFVKNCIAAYVKTLKFQNSKYDKWLKKKVNFTKDEKAGMNLFFSDDLLCSRCHGGKDFDKPVNPDMYPYQNIGLYNIGDSNAYANNDNGVFAVTKDKEDIGRFKIPTLRNIVLTAPYFHDGSAATLEEVIETYAKGGREIKEGPYKGNGQLHPNKHPLIGSFTITAKQKEQLISFLNTLTDTSYLNKKLCQNPFSQ